MSKMVQADTEQAASGLRSPESPQVDPWNLPVIARLRITTEGESELMFQRYSDGGIMLTQSDDRVYLTLVQFDLLKKFLDVKD